MQNVQFSSGCCSSSGSGRLKETQTHTPAVSLVHVFRQRAEGTPTGRWSKATSASEKLSARCGRVSGTEAAGLKSVVFLFLLNSFLSQTSQRGLLQVIGSSVLFALATLFLLCPARKRLTKYHYQKVHLKHVSETCRPFVHKYFSSNKDMKSHLETEAQVVYDHSLFEKGHSCTRRPVSLLVELFMSVIWAQLASGTKVSLRKFLVVYRHLRNGQKLW